MEAKRRIHRMKEDFKDYAMVRAEHQSLRQFESEKNKERRAMRGEGWKKENLSLLGKRVDTEEYAKNISSLFDKKVEKAIDASGKAKELKEKKKLVNKGKNVPVRKW